MTYFPTAQTFVFGPDEYLEHLRRVKVAGGRLAGVVSRADIIRWMTRDPRSARPAL